MRYFSIHISPISKVFSFEDIMEFKLLAGFALFLVGGKAIQTRSSTIAPPEIYWNLVLPNTPIPEAIKEILNLGQENGRQLGNTYEQGGAVNVKFAEINDEEDHTLYEFMEQDILPGNAIYLRLKKRTNKATFVPRGVAESVPFSLKKLPEVFNRFSVKPDSAEGNIIRKIIQRCEELSIKGEDHKSCLTSLESMIEFVTTQLGRDFHAISTEVKEEETLLGQNYMIESGVKKLEGRKFVACHKLYYPYAVFFCHAFNAGEACVVRVPMKGLNGAETVGIGVCHIKQQDWGWVYLTRVPSRMAAAMSGTIPLCHFLAGDSIVWTDKRSVLI